MDLPKNFRTCAAALLCTCAFGCATDDQADIEDTEAAASPVEEGPAPQATTPTSETPWI
jgi:hypothetical protein